MLTVRDIAELPGLGLEFTAGSAGGANPIRWVHVSELLATTRWAACRPASARCSS